MTTYLGRYLRGEHEQVWDELCARRETIHQEPLLEDAIGVAIETMRRVRTNVERITARLHSLGYVFGTYPDGKKISGYTRPHHLPSRNIEKEIADFEQLEGVGKLPLSIVFFWQIVGDVNWMGCHPLWPEYSDPLVVFPTQAARSEYEDWRFAVNEGYMEARQFGIPIAPDYLHKDNVSGGAPYTILVPNAAIDAVLSYERHQTTFVNYLRICFAHGGFPGVQWHNADTPKIMAELSDELLPI